MGRGTNFISYPEKRCVVIGTTRMCTSIIELLCKNSWEILCVVSEDDIVTEHCSKKKITLLSSLSKVKEKHFVLFSVVNYVIIPDDFLKSCNIKYAINYHDSLLPKYGGVNSTTWAIYNNEPTHGVSWHLISSKIDEGKLLKQSSFTIDSNETAFSLNLKCAAEGIRLFSDLLGDFDTGSIVLKKQDLRKKTYFGKDHIPENYGIIDFRDNFGKIDRLRRSLYLGGGNYYNSVGSLKVWDGKAPFLVESLGFTKDESAIPGQVYFSSKSSLAIGIGDGKLTINGIKSPEGEEVCLGDTEFHENKIIEPYCISQEESRLLKRIKKSESGFIKTLCAGSLYNSSFFPTKLGNNSFENYHQRLFFGKQRANSILSKVFLVLLKFVSKDVSIPVKSSVGMESVKESLIRLGTVQKKSAIRRFC
jgi:methionyl-tRNA formyltransferase